MFLHYQNCSPTSNHVRTRLARGSLVAVVAGASRPARAESVAETSSLSPRLWFIRYTEFSLEGRIIPLSERNAKNPYKFYSCQH